MHAGNQSGAGRMTDARRFALLATCRCVIVIFITGIGLTLIGIIFTTFVYDGPFANDPVFKKQFDVFKTAGPIVLSIGLLILCCSIMICVVAVNTGYKIVNGSAQKVESNQAFMNQSNAMTQPLPTNNNELYSVEPLNYGSQPYNTNLQPYLEPTIYHLPEYQQLPLIIDNPPYDLQQYEMTHTDCNLKTELPPPYTEPWQ